MTAPVLTAFPEMTPGVLAHLLDLVGEPGALSPRKLLGPAAPLSPHALAQLYAAGILDAPADSGPALTPEFKRAARVLLQPTTHVTVRVWGRHPICTETSFVFAGRVSKGGGVVFNRTDTFCRISGFANHRTVMELVGGVLPAAGHGQPPSFDAHLDVGAAAALCGLIDLLHRSSNTAAAHTEGPLADDVVAYAGRNWTTAGFGDLMAVLVPMCQAGDAPAASEVRDGLAWLITQGVVSRDEGGRYDVTTAMAPIVSATANLEGGLQWQRVTADADGTVTLSHRVFVVGTAPLVLSITQTTDHRVYVAAVRPEAIVDFIASELAAL